MCKSEGEPVPDDEIKKGYELRRGRSCCRRRGLRSGTKAWIGWIGLVGYLARMVVFGLVGIFLVKAAHGFDPKRPRLGRSAREAPPTTRTADRSSGGRRARTDGIRHLLMVRRPLPADLSQTRQEPAPRRQAQVPLARWSAPRAVPEELVVQRPPSARWSSAFVILERPRMLRSRASS